VGGDKWIPPLQGFLKPNFYGASRGNTGLGGARGMFRNAQGEIISMYIVHREDDQQWGENGGLIGKYAMGKYPGLLSDSSGRGFQTDSFGPRKIH
jgi:hypothetical protein